MSKLHEGAPRGPRHIPRFRHDTLTPGELRMHLTRLKISEAEFCRLTGVRPKTLDDWLDGDGPPYWVTSWITMVEHQPAREAAHARARQDIMTEDEYRELRDAS